MMFIYIITTRSSPFREESYPKGGGDDLLDQEKEICGVVFVLYLFVEKQNDLVWFHLQFLHCYPYTRRTDNQHTEREDIGVR